MENTDTTKVELRNGHAVNQDRSVSSININLTESQPKRTSRYNPQTRNNQHENLISKETKWPWIEFATGSGLIFVGVVLIIIGVSTDKRPSKEHISAHNSLAPAGIVGVVFILIGFGLLVVFGIHYSIIRKEIIKKRMEDYARFGIRPTSQYTVLPSLPQTGLEGFALGPPPAPNRPPGSNHHPIYSIGTKPPPISAEAARQSGLVHHMQQTFRHSQYENPAFQNDEQTHNKLPYVKENEYVDSPYTKTSASPTSRTSDLGSSPSTSYSTKEKPPQTYAYDQKMKQEPFAQNKPINTSSNSKQIVTGRDTSLITAASNQLIQRQNNLQQREPKYTNQTQRQSAVTNTENSVNRDEYFSPVQSQQHDDRPRYDKPRQSANSNLSLNNVNRNEYSSPVQSQKHDDRPRYDKPRQSTNSNLSLNNVNRNEYSSPVQSQQHDDRPRYNTQRGAAYSTPSNNDTTYQIRPIRHQHDSNYQVANRPSSLSDARREQPMPAQPNAAPHSNYRSSQI